MKGKKLGWMVLLMLILVTIPAGMASGLDLVANPNFIRPDISLPASFISAHEEIRAVPLYRVAKAKLDTHLYTVNKDEYESWLSAGIDPDGIAAYISPVPLPYTHPMWNMVKNKLEQYFVVNEADRDYVIIKYDYEDYGVIGYAVPLTDTQHGDANMLQWYRGNDSNLLEDYAELFSDDVHIWNADHYYNNGAVNKEGYEYQGPVFRVWSDDEVLQEVNVLYPAGGEIIKGGTEVDVRWSTLISGGNISLYYTLDPRQGWSMIAENLDNTGSYRWKVPNSVTNTAIVEARWTYEGIDNNCYDQSDKFFSIKAGDLAIVNWQIAFKPQLFSSLLEPAAPTALSAGTSLIQRQPGLYWQDNAGNETAYVIERKVKGGNYSQLAQVSADTEKYTDSSAQPGQTYSYRVKAVNNKLSSAYSNEAAASVWVLPKITLPDPDSELPDSQPKQVTMLFTLNQNSYTVNGEVKPMDVSPLSIGGRTMLPIRFAADPLGADTLWDGNTRKVTVVFGDTRLEMWIGSNTAMVNGKSTLIDPENPGIKPVIINNRTMLPMRFVTEKLGCEVAWNPDLRQIKVDYLDPQPEPPM